MDALPPHVWRAAVAEVRQVDVKCTRGYACWDVDLGGQQNVDAGHEHHEHEHLPDAPDTGDIDMSPMQQLLVTPRLWRRDQGRSWLHAGVVQMFNHSAS
jgi:hypothetical protein